MELPDINDDDDGCGRSGTAVMSARLVGQNATSTNRSAESKIGCWPRHRYGAGGRCPRDSAHFAASSACMPDALLPGRPDGRPVFHLDGYLLALGSCYTTHHGTSLNHGSSIIITDVFTDWEYRTVMLLLLLLLQPEDVVKSFAQRGPTEATNMDRLSSRF